MKTLYLIACVMATAAVGSPLAYSAPGGGTQVTHIRSTHNSAVGNMDSGGISASFSADADDFQGVAQGTISATVFDSNAGNFGFIQCSGPEFASALSVNPGNGNTSVQAALDPSDTLHCVALNVGAPIVLDVTGKFVDYRNSETGSSVEQAYGNTFKYNFQRDRFTEAFSGTNGFVSGAFDGSASTERQFNRVRMK